MLPITEQLATIYVKGYEAISGSNTTTIPSNAIDFNGFKIYRSPNNVATTITYHWPNEDGTMGELRAMEVIDAQYRYISNMNITYDSNSGLVFTPPRSQIAIITVSRFAELPDNTVTNEKICLTFKRFYIDNTAKYNTDEMIDMSFTANNELMTNGATIARGLTTGNIEWSVPNIFQSIVIAVCSDKIDALDPTFNDNKDKGLGYTSTGGRFYFPNSAYYCSFSSTYIDATSVFVIGNQYPVQNNSILHMDGGMTNSNRFIFPVHELTIV